MTNPNPNIARVEGFTSQRNLFDRRQFRSRQPGFAVAAGRPKQKQPAATYFEVLWSLPARKTLPQLLHASS
jgi:hypothetical protein